MSVNKYRPHVLVLPEDDAKRQIANGFLLDESLAAQYIQVLEVAGGWMQVLDRFQSDHIAGMERYPERCMVLLIDSDGKDNRLDDARNRIPGHLLERVLILGVWTEPERLKMELEFSYEQIGRSLAKDCREASGGIWMHHLLQHNAKEISRAGQRIRQIAFPHTQH